MKTILITGGAGFIGLHLARALVGRGDRVIIADNFWRASHDRDLTELSRHRNCILERVDLTKSFVPSSTPDVIVHLAAIVGVENVVKSPAKVLTTNVQALQMVLEQALTFRNLRNFIFASTSEVYAGSVAMDRAAIPTPEDTPLTLMESGEPRSTYMLSKIYGEAMCLASGLPVTIIRPHNIYGPRMGLSHVIPELLQQAWYAAPGSFLDVASVDHTRTFCFVTDAVRYLMSVLDSPGEGKIYNLGRQEPEISIGDLALHIIAAVQKELTVNPRPATRGSPRRRAPNMTSLVRFTGIQPAYNLTDGIRYTLNWYRENVFLRSRGN